MSHYCDVKSSALNYRVEIGRDLLSHAGVKIAALHLGRRAAMIADKTVAPLYASTLEKSLREAGISPLTFTVKAGETTKNWQQVGDLLSQLAQNRFERNDFIIALGGGVIGDLAGFVSAVYLRGLPLIQIPTTLLAMVDSSVGGKTGVNLPEGKNLAGAFYPPRLVLADLNTLATLPPRELAAGMAEVIKCGLIADAQLFAEVEAGKQDDLAGIVHRCVEIKAKIVEEDELETKDQRALLNFGHTLGHAIEQAAGYGTYLHGEAVAIGMRAAAYLSHHALGLNMEDITRFEKALTANALPLFAKGLQSDQLLEAMTRDKKRASGVNRWVLIPRIGEAKVVSDVVPDQVEQAIEKILK